MSPEWAKRTENTMESVIALLSACFSVAIIGYVVAFIIIGQE